MRNVNNEISGKGNQFPDTPKNLSRRQVIGGLSTLTLGLPLLAVLENSLHQCHLTHNKAPPLTFRHVLKVQLIYLALTSPRAGPFP
jgi:hypothetical protein